MFITEADPAHIANIWQRVRAMFVRASDIVGAIPALAALSLLRPSRRREIASCIAVVEAIVRKLIFIEAAGIRRAESAAQASRLPRLEVISRPSPSWSAALGAACVEGAAHSNLQPFDPTQPETWRVRFKLAPPRDPQARAESKAPRVRALLASSPPLPPPSPPQPPRHVTPTPLRLALRFEALRRAIADPAPLARKLARTLSRLCRRYHDAAVRYAVATARPYRCDPGDPRLIVEAMALALMVAPLFVNSS